MDTLLNHLNKYGDFYYKYNKVHRSYPISAQNSIGVDRVGYYDQITSRVVAGEKFIM